MEWPPPKSNFKSSSYVYKRKRSLSGGGKKMLHIFKNATIYTMDEKNTILEHADLWIKNEKKLLKLE